MSHTRRSLFRIMSIGVTSLALVAALAPSPASGVGNLLPNPGFEDSVLEPIPELQYTQPQPVLPTGWAFEGSAGLFDHSPNGFHTGRRMAAISIPASGNRNVCAQPPVGCHANPANIVKDEAEKVYSIGPAWRNAVPVPVSPGSYTLSVWVSGDIITENEGAVTAVRWLDATGAPVGLSRGPERRTTQFNPITGAWVQISGSVTAPGNAAQAVVLLGHSHDLWIGQVRFDDVSFG